MGDSLFFGAAYYAEYMPYDRVEEDLGMMMGAGMNVIRIAESTWSTLEPCEGVFDFTYSVFTMMLSLMGCVIVLA